MEEQLHLLTDQGCHPIGYADDILVIVRGMYLDALMGVIQQALKVVDTWCRTTGLSVNPGKTEVVIFTRRYKWSTTRTLELKGQRLEASKRAKYLGVILDKKLTWKARNYGRGRNIRICSDSRAAYFLFHKFLCQNSLFFVRICLE